MAYDPNPFPGDVNITTTAVPIVSATGLVVALKSGASVTAQVSGAVSISGTAIVSVVPGVSVIAQVSGPVSISGTAAVSVVGGTINTILGTQVVSIVPNVSVTIQQGASISAPAFSGVVASSVPATSNALGIPMWIVGGQTATGTPVQVSISVSAILGTIIAVSGVSTIVTILGTQIVSVVPGVSVSLPAVSGVVASSVPATSNALGIPMWIVGGQTATGTPVQVSISVSATVGTIIAVSGITAVSAVSTIVTILGTQIVSVVPGVSVVALVSVSASAILGTIIAISGITAVSAISTIVTILGTAVVSVVPGLSVSLPAVSGVVASSTAATSNALGMPVWIVGGQTATGVPIQVSISVSATVGTIIAISGVTAVSAVSTIVTILGTQIVSVVPGVSVVALVSVSASAILGTIVAISGITAVSAVSTIVTILGTQIVSVVPGVSVVGLVSISVSAILGTIVTILGTLSVIGINQTTVTPAAGATGDIVYVANITAVTVTGTGLFGTAVYFGYTTAVAETTRVQPAFSIGLNLTTVAATTQWVVPGGKTFRILSINVFGKNTLASIGAGAVRVWVMASTAAFTTTAPAFGFVGAAAITSATGAPFAAGFMAGGIGPDLPAGATVNINYSVTGASSMPVEIAVMGAMYP